MALLIEATDAHFAWLLGEPVPPPPLSLPPGGLGEAWVHRWLRRCLARIEPPCSWLMVVGGEVVGTCAYKTAANAEGAVEIGYGVAESLRRRGHATRAVAELAMEAARDPRIRALVAETAVDNVASQRVVEANGFAKVGTSVDVDEGEMIVWRLEMGGTVVSTTAS